MRKNSIRRIESLLLAMVMVLGSIIDVSGSEVHAAAKNATPKLSKSSVQVLIGKTTALKVKGGKKGAKVEWTSRNNKIASISKKGVIQGRKKGGVQITARITVNRKKYRRTCKVAVIKKAKRVSITGSDVESGHGIELWQGESVSLGVGKNPKSSNDVVSSWKSSDASVASVDKRGELTALQAGTAIVTVTMFGKAKASLDVTVLADGDAEEDSAEVPTKAPAGRSTEAPMERPTETPTERPIENPTEEPTERPTEEPTEEPTERPTEEPTEAPTERPTEGPTEAPTERPTEGPTEAPTERPTEAPTERPTETPTEAPTERPTEGPTEAPTERPTETPTEAPTERPTEAPTEKPTVEPTQTPIPAPTARIKISSGFWDTFLEIITFGIYHKEEQEVEISAESPVGIASIEYCITMTDVTVDQMGMLTFIPYDDNDRPKLKKGTSRIVYAHVVDQKGTEIYIRSDGVVIEDNAPSPTPTMEPTESRTEEPTPTVSPKPTMSISPDPIPTVVPTIRPDVPFYMNVEVGSETVETSVSINDGAFGDSGVRPLDGANGYETSYGFSGGEYGELFAKFDLALPEGTTWLDYESVTYTFQIENAYAWYDKSFALAVAPKEQGLPGALEFDYDSQRILNAATVTMVKKLSGDAGEQQVVLEVDPEAAARLEGSEFECALFFNLEGDMADPYTKYTVSDIAIHKNGEGPPISPPTPEPTPEPTPIPARIPFFMDITVGSETVRTTAVQNVDDGDSWNNAVRPTEGTNGYVVNRGRRGSHHVFAKFDLAIPEGETWLDYESVAFTLINGNGSGKFTNTPAVLVAAPKGQGLPDVLEYDGSQTILNAACVSHMMELAGNYYEELPVVMGIRSEVAEQLEGNEFECALYVLSTYYTLTDIAIHRKGEGPPTMPEPSARPVPSVGPFTMDVEVGDATAETVVSRNSGAFGDSSVRPFDGANGYEASYGFSGGDYGELFAKFDLVLPEGTTWSDYESVAYTFQIENANGWYDKSFALAVAPKGQGLPGALEFDYDSQRILNAATVTKVTKLSGDAGEQQVVLEVNPEVAELPEGSEFECALFFNLEGDMVNPYTKYTVSDIAIHKNGEGPPIPTPTPTPPAGGFKDENDVRELSAIIASQRERGSNVSEDIDGSEYSWNWQTGKLTGIDWGYKELKGKLDVSGLTSLRSLDCRGNQLAELDVSGLTSLTSLYCYRNQLTELNVSGCTSLRSLDCDDNQLTELDVSGLASLLDLFCGGNQIQELDMNGLMSLRSLYCYGNQLRELDVNSFTSLTYLDCGENQLKELDVSDVTSLESLGCDGNQLTELDVSGFTSLTYLSCSNNQLIELDVSSLTPLTYLSCGGNQLMELDVSSLTSLASLGCGGNQLMELDVSGLTSLTDLECNGNQLIELNVSGLTSLTDLNCSENQLTELDVSGCTSLTNLYYDEGVNVIGRDDE